MNHNVITIAAFSLIVRQVVAVKNIDQLYIWYDRKRQSFAIFSHSKRFAA